LVSIERFSEGLSSAIKTIEIIEESMEIGLNEICDTHNNLLGWLDLDPTKYPTVVLTTVLIIWLYYHPKEWIPNLNTFLRI